MWEASRPLLTVSFSRVASAGVENHILFMVQSEGPFGKIGGYHGEGVDSGGRSASELLLLRKGEKAPNSGSCSPFFWKEPRKSGT